MGWLGWTEQQTLDTTIPAIETAFRGRVEMLKACFGSGDDKPKPEPEPQRVSGKTLFAMMRTLAGGKR